MLAFHDGYRERVTLRDGSRVVLRPVRPDDKALLRRGFERLSPESRYRRFLAPKSQLSDAELAYLTEVDGQNHFALGAVTEGGDREEGIAVARFIRSRTDPRVAEVAVAVIDDWHGRGLGTVLLLRLCAAARERGIDRFVGQALATNLAVKDVLDQLDGGVEVEPQGDELAFALDLPAVPAAAAPQPEDAGTPLRRLLRLVARNLLSVRHPPGIGRAHPGD